MAKLGTERLQITEDGKSEYVIVRSFNAHPAEMTAAEEIQRYIKKISGADITVKTDIDAVEGKKIVIGRTVLYDDSTVDYDGLGSDGFIIRCIDCDLLIAGGKPRGTLYGVYTFLEEYAGCRFYLEDFEKVPENKTISVPYIVEDRQIPKFIFRDDAWKAYVGTWISAKRKINFKTWDRALTEDVGGGIAYAMEEGGHTFSKFVDPDIYFEEHPEYFSMNEKGERVRNTQLCLTNPDVLRIVKTGVRTWLKKDPGAQIVSISQNDAEGPCLCEKCRRVYEEEGGAYSGTLIRFVNAIAEDIADDYPELWVDTYAYTYSRSAPKKTKPLPNVHIRLCTIRNCMSHNYGGGCEDLSPATDIYGGHNSFMHDLNDWSSICKSIFMYDYTSNPQHQLMTFPNFSNMLHNFRMFAEHNAIGIMVEGNWTSPSGEMGDLKAYLISKLLWDPYMSEEQYYEYMDEFLHDVYGPGGTFIRQYIDLSEKLTKKICFKLGEELPVLYPNEILKNHSEDTLPDDLTAEEIRGYKSVNWGKYWDWYYKVSENPITAEGEKLFAAALELAQTDYQRDSIRRISAQVAYTKSFYLKDRLDTGLKNLTAILKNYVCTHPNEFTDCEKETIVEEVAEYVRSAELEKYRQYNTELYEMLLSVGITHLYSGLELKDRSIFDFNNVPVDWFERYWLHV